VPSLSLWCSVQHSSFRIPRWTGARFEVYAGDDAHEDPHDDAGFRAQHEGVGEAEDLVGQEAGGDAEDEPAGSFVRRPGVDAPGGADEGRPQGHVGDKAGDAQVDGDLEEFVVGVGDGVVVA